MRRHFILSIILSLFVSAFAYASDIDVSIQGRGAFYADKQENGFKADYLNLLAKGNLGKHFSFIVRHELNKPTTNKELLNATDFLNLTYSTGDWSFSAGKYTLAVGGFEYDAAPIDIYFASEYWDNFGGCFEYAVSAARRFGAEQLTFQFARSPFGNSDKALSGRYAYSLQLLGEAEHWKHIYSVNFLEKETKGEFVNFIALGNKFVFDKFSVYLDLQHRMECSKPTFFKDFTLSSRADFAPAEWVNLFGRADYDYNTSGSATIVSNGTEAFRYGFGAEFFPWEGREDIRFHSVFYNDTRTKTPCLMLGLTLKLHLIRK